MNKYRLRYTIEINKCRKLKNNIKNLETNIYYITDYKNELVQKTKLEHLLERT